MADFVAVLRKAIDGVQDPTPELRQKVYQKARATVAAKLAGMSPPPPAAAAERQKQALEDAIAFIENEYAAPEPEADFDELEDVFASLTEIEAPRDLSPPRVEPARPRVDDAWTPAPVATPARPSAAASGWDVDEEPAMSTRPQPTFPALDDEPTIGAPGRDGYGGYEPEEGEYDPQPERRRSRSGTIAVVIAAAVVLVLGGGGYVLWQNGTFQGLPDLAATAPSAVEPVADEGTDAAEEEVDQAALPEETDTPAPDAGTPLGEPPAAEPPAGETPEAEAPAAAPAGPQKFTQRLNPDGSEIDVGPAGGGSSFGEGTSVAEATTPPPATAPAAAAPAETPAPTEPAQEEAPAAAAVAEAEPPAAPDAPAASPTLAVGQRAIFYEERTSAAQGSAEPGSIVWSTVQESPGDGQPPEPAIRAEASIPGKEIQLRMTIRRNADRTLPASHIVEMIFLTPDDFEGGGIENVLRMTMKDSEQATGNPLLGIPAKISDGFFLIALADGQAETEANTTLLRRESWIDIPIVYRSGRRALITLEKGIPGERAFDEALRAWSASSG